MRLAGLRPELLVGVLLADRPAGRSRLGANACPQLRSNWCGETVQNEINSNNATKFMFRQREENEHGSQTKLIVETKEVAAGMLVAINDKPLTAEERQKEQARLDGLVNNPQELKKKQKADQGRHGTNQSNHEGIAGGVSLSARRCPERDKRDGQSGR